jgi:hypothetical protein
MRMQEEGGRKYLVDEEKSSECRQRRDRKMKE